jgi:hypothetical protein
MAAIIAASGTETDGLAPSAKVISVRITIGTGGTPDMMAAGIRYAISKHVNVINLSQRTLTTNANLANAVQQALAADIVIVAASGDETQSTVDYPAAYPGVVAVGAISQNGTIWSNSNTGPQVTLAAPGVNVPTEDNFGSAATTDGTSAATAYVSATVALVRAAHPSWTAGQVIRDLIATADPASGQTAGQHSDQYGYGIVDPLKALQAAAPSETSNPLLASASSSASAVASAGATATGGGGTASSSKSGSGLVVGVIVTVVVVLLIIVLIVVLSRRNRDRRGGGGPGGGPGVGGSGGQPPYGQYAQQNPYQQQANPYQQPGAQQQHYGQTQPQHQQQYPYPAQNPYPPHDPQQGQPPQR